jgi:hypothetical protein
MYDALPALRRISGTAKLTRLPDLANTIRRRSRGAKGPLRRQLINAHKE